MLALHITHFLDSMTVTRYIVAVIMLNKLKKLTVSA